MPAGEAYYDPVKPWLCNGVPTYKFDWVYMRFHYGFIVQESHEKNVISWAKFRITNQAKQKNKQNFKKYHKQCSKSEARSPVWLQ